MRFLADEGVVGAIVGGLRSDGHDVRWMAEEPGETKDNVVLGARAIREHEADLSGGFTVIQPGTIRIRRA
jgi:hypothetical protein